MDRPFVGRERELARAGGALSESSASTLRIIGVCGEAGIGKSRFTQELLRSAPTGMLSHWVHFARNGPRGPLAAWESLLMEIPSDVPLREALGELPTATDVPADRIEFFHRVSEAIRTAATTVPLVLVLEDVHQIDALSARLVEHLCHELWDTPVSVVATRRGAETSLNHHAEELVRSLCSLPGWREIRLQSLVRSEMETLVASLGDHPACVDPDYGAAWLIRQTAGNPFFVWAFLDQFHAGGPRNEPPRTPEAALLLISGRVRALPDPAQRLLELLAVAGGRASLDRVRACLPAGNLLDMADLAARHGLLAVEETGALRLAHDLIHESVYNGLSSTERARIHGDLARAMEKEAAAAAQNATGIAHHYRRAIAGSGTEPYFRWACVAAEEELRGLAFENVLATVDAALELQPPALVEARLRFARGRALASNAQTFESVEDLAQAFLLYRDGELLEEAVRVASYPIVSNPVPPGMVDLASEALEIATDPRDRARLTIAVAFAQYHRDHDAKRAVRLLEAALEVLADDRDTQHRFLGTVRLAQIAFFDVRLQRALEIAASVADDTSQMPVFVRGLAHLIAGFCAGFLGEMATGDFHLAQAHRHANRVGIPQLIIPGEIQQQFQLYVTASISRALEQNARTERFPFPIPSNRAFALKLLVQMDREAEARERYEELIAGLSGEDVPVWLFNVADAAFFLNDEAMASLVIRRVLDPHLATESPLERALAWSSAVLCRTVIQDHQRIGLPPVDFHIPPIQMQFVRPFALLGTAPPDEVAAAFEESHAALTEMGAFLYSSWLLYKRAMLLPPDDPAELRAILERSRAAALAYNLPLLDRLSTEAILRHDGALAHAAARLTRREQEVLDLLATGLSNAEIGESLFISRHTVANHVRNILEKTGCQNRTELARTAILTDSGA